MTQTIHLSDYQPYPYLLDRVSLVFDLAPSTTRVKATLNFAPNPARPGAHDLHLDGEQMTLISARINGVPITAKPDATGLTIAAKDLPTGPFTLETEVQIDPASNTSLDGLYMSNGMYCTQCEAQGFRKITYYPDRPDVMARFHVRVNADLPVLLSNGNPVGQGKGFAEWDDPWPKPAYLFALVAGDLRAHSAPFTTMSGKPVALNIYVRPGDEDRCDYAMGALIRSMIWDEQVYGREYDLNIFNIVAVDDFNMGAMENKGLNIFNSKLVLALPETASDDDFGRIEAVIAHEYFHNWTGNRITCRDWFQLCLKEGLTVFRDQQFSGDMRSHAVKRIEDVLTLRTRQFREDGGPLAHPVRPDSFVEINNFYTATVYEKGAEVIGMMKTLVGDADYARALDLYFTRHDGEAATIEDWLKVFEDTTGRDLAEFKRWYTEAGTPRLTVTDDWAPQVSGGTYTLHITQSNPPTPGQPTKAPKVIPVAVGLLNPNGDEVLPTTVLELTKSTQSFTFQNLASKPIPSILRNFSAPVILERDQAAHERAFLLAHDTDPFNKWESGRALAKDVLARMVTEAAAPSSDWLDALAQVAADETLDPAFRALSLRLPGEDDMAQTLFAAGHVPDPAAIHHARRQMATAVAKRLAPTLAPMVASLADTGPFVSDAMGSGKRALKLTALSYLTSLDHGKAASQIFNTAGNMTDEQGALAALLDAGLGQAELATFEAKWHTDRLVMDKWFALQVAYAAPDVAAATADRLTQHRAFDWKNPNRFRSVFGPLSANHAGFHHASGAGYRLMADWLIKLDPVNPQTAARMSTAFESWTRYSPGHQNLARANLARILNTPDLSRNLGEMITRMLGAT